MPDTVTLRPLKRLPKPLKHFENTGIKVFSAEFTINTSEATRFARITGKRKRWYLVRHGNTYDVYDKRGKYYGSFMKTELFGTKKVIINR